MNTAVLQRFGAAPDSEGDLVGPVDWAEEVLREYVLPEQHPDVVLNWPTQPDGAHHGFGTGSPEGTMAIPLETRSFATFAPDGDYRAAIQVTQVAQQRYVDKSWRF